MTRLQERFERLWKTMKCSGGGTEVAVALLDAYGEAGRFYHGVNHLRDCLDELDRFSHLAEHPQEIEIALWFHDAVYDPKSKENETKSAEWAKRVLTEAGLNPASVDRIEEMILATKHQVIPSDRDSILLVDIDLSILGRSEEVFLDYDQKIRQEYAWVPEETFRNGRKQILQSFLDRPRIFQMEAIHVKYEVPARKNLRKLISKLEPGSEPHPTSLSKGRS